MCGICDNGGPKGQLRLVWFSLSGDMWRCCKLFHKNLWQAGSNCSNQKSRDDRQATRQHLLPRSPGWCKNQVPHHSRNKLWSPLIPPGFSASSVLHRRSPWVQIMSWCIDHLASLYAVGNCKNTTCQGRHSTSRKRINIATQTPAPIYSNLLWYCHMCIMHCHLEKPWTVKSLCWSGTGEASLGLAKVCKSSACSRLEEFSPESDSNGLRWFKHLEICQTPAHHGIYTFMVMTSKLSAYDFSHQFWDSFHCAEPPRPCEAVSSVATSAVRRSSSTWPWQSLDVVPVTNSWSKSRRAHNSLAACLDVAKIPTNLGNRSFDHIPYHII